MAHGPQPTARRAGSVATVVALVCLIAAPATHAAKGDGPYTPFPDDANGRAVGFVNKLYKRPGGSGSVSDGETSGGAPSARRQIAAHELAKGVYLPQGPDGPLRVGTRSRPTDSGSGAGQAAAVSNPFDRAGPGVAAQAGHSGRPDVPSSLPFLAAGVLLSLGAGRVAFASRPQPQPRPRPQPQPQPQPGNG